MEISKSDLDSWLALPLTKHYFASIKEKVKEIEIQLGLGTCLDTSSTDAIAIQYARIVGRIEGLNDRLDIEAQEDAD